MNCILDSHLLPCFLRYLPFLSILPISAIKESKGKVLGHSESSYLIRGVMLRLISDWVELF